jgi:hypothetical protein
LQPTGIAWFRRRQSALARAVLALFCVAWLQLAALPCAMAYAGGAASLPAPDAASATEHCPYCPPAQSPAETGAHGACAYPHDPQVDARGTLAQALLLPALAPVLALSVPVAPVARLAPATAEPARSATPLAVTFCRYLK